MVSKIKIGTAWPLAVLLLLASPAFGAARHVYLNSSGGGSQLNSCPNPAHNLKGVAGDTSEMSYCLGGALNSVIDRFICDAVAGCKAWTTTTGQCTSPANLGTVTPVTNGTSVNIEATGTGSPSYTVVYGSPQACVWNMAKSDSCEVHAGTYKSAGAEWPNNVFGDTSSACTRSECILATIAALGQGPGLAASGYTGYGTALAPGYLRGAAQNGSTDTWDSNGNKVPDVDESITGYAPILSGDMDKDGTPKEPTHCAAGVCSGDGFYPIILGCGSSTSGAVVCHTGSLAAGETRPLIDTDANGSFDTAISANNRSTLYFTMKDIEATGYGGGPDACVDSTGVREKLGSFSIGGGASSPGPGGDVWDHLYVHDFAYSTACTSPSLGTTEHYVAMFGDDESGENCVGNHDIKNSYLVSDNRFVINDDSDSWGTGTIESGCGWHLHDNRVVITDPVGAVNGYRRKGIIRLKSTDTLDGGARAKKWVIYNNEFIWEAANIDGNFDWAIHSECIGKCGPHPSGLGEFDWHGNLFRFRGAGAKFTGGGHPFMGSSCASDGSLTTSPTFTLRAYNNTFDMETSSGATTHFGRDGVPVGGFCDFAGNLVIGRNNAWYRADRINQDTAFVSSNQRYGAAGCSTVAGCTNACSHNGSPANVSCPTTASPTRSVWFNHSAYGSARQANADPTTAAYKPITGSPIYETGSCDPDGDGIAGVDYDQDGVNDTTWTDLVGNVVNCSSIANAISIGAFQPNSEAPAIIVCGNGAVEAGETCDDGTQPVDACAYNDSPPLQQVCNATCTGTTDCASPQYCGDSTVQTLFEACDGALLNGHNCAEFGCSLGTPSCVSCSISSAGCSSCAALNPDLMGVDLYGVSVNP